MHYLEVLAPSLYGWAKMNKPSLFRKTMLCMWVKIHEPLSKVNAIDFSPTVLAPRLWIPGYLVIVYHGDPLYCDDCEERYYIKAYCSAANRLIRYPALSKTFGTVERRPNTYWDFCSRQGSRAKCQAFWKMSWNNQRGRSKLPRSWTCYFWLTSI